MKQVIVLRKDLGMNKGKMIAQGAHASSMFIIKDQRWYKDKDAYDWAYVEGMAKIVVGVNSLEELEVLETAAKKAGLLTYSVIDSGKTVVEPGTKTAIAIGPDKDEEVDKITGNLKLL
jgi:peptidyl-tRNA hydrolase, PTH2 family